MKRNAPLQRRKPLQAKAALARNGSALKRTGKLKPMSAKRAKEETRYRALKAAWRPLHPVCQVCEQSPTDHVHHMEGRGPNLNNVATWLATCAPCHTWIHEHPNQARANGWLK